MLARTGNHGRAVERRVPEMGRIVEFNCISTNPESRGRIGILTQPLQQNKGPEPLAY